MSIRMLIRFAEQDRPRTVNVHCSDVSVERVCVPTFILDFRFRPSAEPCSTLASRDICRPGVVSAPLTLYQLLLAFLYVPHNLRMVGQMLLESGIVPDRLSGVGSATRRLVAGPP